MLNLFLKKKKKKKNLIEIYFSLLYFDVGELEVTFQIVFN